MRHNNGDIFQAVSFPRFLLGGLESIVVSTERLIPDCESENVVHMRDRRTGFGTIISIYPYD